MSIKKLTSVLAMLAISCLIFTACEDTVAPTDPANPTPAAVSNIRAGVISNSTIAVQWDHSTSRDSSWFKEYRVVVSNPLAGSDAEYTVAKTSNGLTLSDATLGTTYTFSVTAISDSGKVSVARTISWALSNHFDTNDTGNDIKVYGSNSSSYGSGLNLYSVESAPSTWKLASAANWNLGLYTRESKILFGSASVLGYSSTFPNSATITDPIDVDTDKLDGLLLTGSLSSYSFSSKTIDLKSAVATSKSSGLTFFAKVGDNYAKVIIKKVGGSYLQNAGTNDEFVQLLVSYQTRAGVPYAKFFAGK